MLMYTTFGVDLNKEILKEGCGVWGHVRTKTLDSLVGLSPAAVLDASPLLGSGPSLVSGPFLGASPSLSELSPSPGSKVNVM